MRAFFYDTWAFVALANAADPQHALGAQCDEELERRGFAPVTSDYVLDETLTCLHAAAGAKVALAFLDLLTSRVDAEELLLFEITRPRRDTALRLFRRLAPTEPRLSFTDCTSFQLMHELGIQLAFTADRHFHRAGRGVRPLLDWRGKRLELRLPVE